MSNYDRFAEVYDRLMDDVDYKARTDYLLTLFEKHDRRPTLLLDLACGTGGYFGGNVSISAAKFRRVQNRRALPLPARRGIRPLRHGGRRCLLP